MAALSLPAAPAAPADLSPHIISLARMIARDCHAQGSYAVNLIVSPYPSVPLQVEIKQVSTVRAATLERKAEGP